MIFQSVIFFYTFGEKFGSIGNLEFLKLLLLITKGKQTVIYHLDFNFWGCVFFYLL